MLVCAGSLGLGRVGRAVTGVLAAGPEVQAVAVCGRNEELREELAARPGPIGVDGGAADYHREFAAVTLDARMVVTKARLLDLPVGRCLWPSG